VCSEEEYTKVFDRLNTLPPRVEHLIIQLGNASPSVTVNLSETDCLLRDPNCLSPHGVFGERVGIEIQSSCYIGEG
jgi:hypothetical protein